MSQGNLHYYFASKEALFKALLEAMLMVFVTDRESKRTQKAHDPRQLLEIFFQQEHEILNQRRAYMDVKFDFWVQATVDPEIAGQISLMYANWHDDISAIVQRGVREGIFSDTHADQVPYLMVAIMEGAALQTRIVGESLDLQAYFAAAYRSILSLLDDSVEVS